MGGDRLRSGSGSAAGFDKSVLSLLDCVDLCGERQEGRLPPACNRLWLALGSTSDLPSLGTGSIRCQVSLAGDSREAYRVSGLLGDTSLWQRKHERAGIS